MVAHGGIVKPNIASTKIIVDGCITVGNWIRNKASDLVQQDIIHTEPPDKILNVTHMLLVEFGGK